jgi:hypothetical protein
MRTTQKIGNVGSFWRFGPTSQVPIDVEPADDLTTDASFGETLERAGITVGAAMTRRAPSFYGGEASVPMSNIIGTIGVFSAAPASDDLRALTDRIAALEAKVEALQASLHVVEELGWEDALARAREYFESHPDLPTTPDILAEEIGTSIEQAVELSEYLMGEGLLVASRIGTT